MKRNGLNLLTLIFVSVLLLQSGCQEQAKAPEKSTRMLAKPEPLIHQVDVEAMPQPDDRANDGCTIGTGRQFVDE